MNTIMEGITGMLTVYIKYIKGNRVVEWCNSGPSIFNVPFKVGVSQSGYRLITTSIVRVDTSRIGKKQR